MGQSQSVIQTVSTTLSSWKASSPRETPPGYPLQQKTIHGFFRTSCGGKIESKYIEMLNTKRKRAENDDPPAPPAPARHRQRQTRTHLYHVSYRHSKPKVRAGMTTTHPCQARGPTSSRLFSLRASRSGRIATRPRTSIIGRTASRLSNVFVLY